MRLLFLLFVVFSQEILAKVRYDNYKVFRLTPRSEEEVDYLRGLAENRDYDFWTEARGIGRSVDIMVPPHLQFEFDGMTRSRGLNKTVFISDVQKLIDRETPKVNAKATRALDWSQYSTLEEINQFLEDLKTEFPDNVELVVAGKSYEGRDILGVKVSFTPGLQNRTVFVESNIHAREWITSAVSTWILNQLLRSEDPRVRAVADTHDWYFVPVFNPDGFAYTHSTDRMWRKTRTPYFFCSGVDPNRNWGHHFNDGGSSGFSCDETYRGPEAFSEVSTRTLSEFIAPIAPELRAYISFHSYSQLLLLPYGYSSNHLDNYNELKRVGDLAAENLKKIHGTEYEVGNIVEVLYVASGGSMDWVKGTYGTPITYTYELRDKGQYGFILPPEQIIPTAEETFESFLTIFEEFNDNA